MKFSRLLVIAVVAALASCGGGKKSGKKDVKAVEGTYTDEEGNESAIYSGGVFKMNQSEKPSTLFPHGVAELTAHHIANQIYQGLVRLNQKTLEVENCIAEDRSVNEDATVFTYKIRQGVFFHDDMCFKGGKGREVTAEDFKYCLDQLCTPNSKTKTKQNDLGGMVRSKIQGGQEYYDSFSSGSPLAEGVSGVKVVDKYTLEITLTSPFAGFNNIMSTGAGWVFPREAVESYGEDMRTKTVGTGPFMRKDINLDDKVYLQRNPNYWEADEHGNKLPYLEGLKYTFIAEKKTEFQGFNKRELDMVWRIPVDEIDNVLGEIGNADENAKQILQTTSDLETRGLTIQYYAFLQGSAVFDDKRVRQAFNMAIDREKLVDYTLHGEGEPAMNGIVPPIKGYPIDSVNGYGFDLEQAKNLLAAAGYPNGRGFPKVELYLNRGGNINVLLAEAVQHQLKENLGVTIEFIILPLEQHRLKFETGNADFWRAAWVADYPDPENFLNLFHSRHVPADPHERTFYNASRYKNPAFDDLYDRAVQTVDFDERMALFAEADQILVDDAVVLPIYYDMYERLLNKAVKNFPINAMEYRDFTRVFFDKSEMTE